MQQARRHLLLPLILVSGNLFCASPGICSDVGRNSYASEIVKDVREDKVYLLENIRHRVTKPSEKALVEALLSEDGPKAASLYRKQLSEHPDPQLDDISRSRLAAYERTMAATAKPLMTTQKPAAPAAQTPAIAIPATAAKRPDTVAKKPAAPTATKSPAPALAPASAPTVSAAKKPDSVSRQSVPKPAPAKTPAPMAAPAPAAPKPAAGGAFTLQFGSFDNRSNAEQLAAQLSSSSPAKVVEVGGVFKVRLRKSFTTREEASAFRHSLPYESFVVTDQP